VSERAFAEDSSDESREMATDGYCTNIPLNSFGSLGAG